ncbi:MAG: ATP-binding protein [Erysipelotrichaceae bacterium]|nr:ATP-binding protein [Erysipelotrichaceae bacterium]
MAKLIVLSGVPGSGKSYFSASLRKAKGSHVYVVSSDALRTVILGNQQDLSEDRLMWKMYYKLAYVYATDPKGVVVLDATHSNSTYRIEATKFLKPLFDEIDLVLFNLPRHIVNKQNAERPFPVPEDVLDLLCAKFELPDDDDREYFHHIFIINSHDIDSIIAQI